MKCKKTNKTKKLIYHRVQNTTKKTDKSMNFPKKTIEKQK